MQPAFLLDPQRYANSVTVHVPGEGGWTSAGEILNQEPDWFAGGHGLYSTPRDYVPDRGGSGGTACC